MLYRLFTGEVNRRWVGEPQTLVCSEVSRRSSQCIKENFSRGLQLKSSARRDLSARAYQSRNFACFLMMKKPIFEVVVFADRLPMPSTADINTAAGGGPPKRFGQLLSYRRVSLFLADYYSVCPKMLMNGNSSPKLVKSNDDFMLFMNSSRNFGD